MESNKNPIDLRRLLLLAKESGDAKTFLEPYAFKGVNTDLLISLKEKGFDCYRGKVRECFSRDQNTYLIHTDNLSAFDRFITTVPFKGMLLAEISRYWYEALGAKVTHAYLASPHARVLAMKKLKPIKAEVIVRAYLAGSMLRAYQGGVRTFCGQRLPDGLKAYQKLPAPMVTPTSKAEAFEHDENQSPAELIRSGYVSDEEEWNKIEEKALQLFHFGTDKYAACGWIFADTKYEFGLDQSGEVKLIDEVHTPDSSRLWRMDSYQHCFECGKDPEMFDKEIVRRYLASQGFTGEGVIPPVPYSLIIELIESYLGIYESLKSRPLSFAYQDLNSSLLDL